MRGLLLLRSPGFPLPLLVKQISSASCGRRTNTIAKLAVEVFCYRLLKSEQGAEIKPSYLLPYRYGFWREAESKSTSRHPIGYTQWSRDRTAYVTAQSRPSGASPGIYWSSVVMFIMTSVRMCDV